MTDTEQALREVIRETFEDEELTELQWKVSPKTVRFEIPLRYMTRTELRDLLDVIGGSIQACITATHDERRTRSMISVIHDELRIAQMANQDFRNIQRERIVKRIQGTQND